MDTHGKTKKVIAEVVEVTDYIAQTDCPYCGERNDREVEEDNITMTETCWNCKTKDKIKIPKNSI